MYFIYNNKCKICRRAYMYLINNNITFEERDIITNNPSIEEINSWIDKYKIDIYSLVNKSGYLLKKMNLDNKIYDMSENELISLISSNGMFVKRPILLLENDIIIGFKKDKWNEALLKL